MPWSGPLGRHLTRPRPTIQRYADSGGAAQTAGTVTPPPPPPTDTYYNAVTQGGIGTTTTYSALQTAMSSSISLGYDGIYFPAGTYTFSGTLTVPVGTTVVGPTTTLGAVGTRGCSTPTAWLKGKVRWNSNTTFNHVRLGDVNYAVWPVHNSSYATFNQCQLRGGGGTADNMAVITMGYSNSCHHVYFNNCNFERNCSTQLGSATIGNNIISLNNRTEVNGVQVDHVYFYRNHWGVDNGVSGQVYTPRAAIECTNRNEGSLAPVKGYSYVHFIENVFEKTGWFVVDVADPWQKTNNILVKDNIIKGAGTAGPLGYAVCFECPMSSIIEGNTIGRCRDTPIKMAYAENAVNNTIIRNNIMDQRVSADIPTPSRPAFYIVGGGVQIYGNQVWMDYNEHIWEFWDCQNAYVYNNTITVTTATHTEQWAQFSTTSGARVINNTLRTRAAVNPGWENNATSGNSNLTYSPNTITLNYT